MKHMALFVLLLVNSILFGQSDPITTLPFTLENNAIYFYCKVNQTDSLKFLFDTGANVTVINQTSDKIKLESSGKQSNMGSNGVNEVDQSFGNTVSFGKITRTDLSLTIIPYGITDFDGVFGSNLMQDHIIEIDYFKNELRFYDPGTYANDLGGYDRVKIHFVNDYPAIESEIVIDRKKYKGYFGLDTGAGDALTISSPFAKKNNFAGKMSKMGSATFQGSDGSVYESSIVSMPELKLGKKSFYSIPVSLSVSQNGIDASAEIAGFYGNNFLKRFNTVIDLKTGYIYFKPNDNLYTEFNSFE